jgi:hypothetical protein
MVRLTKILLACALCPFASALLSPSYLNGQLISFSKQDLIDYTAQNPFERFPDGRPKVPDDLIERARGVSRAKPAACLLLTRREASGQCAAKDSCAGMPGRSAGEHSDFGLGLGKPGGKNIRL